MKTLLPFMAAFLLVGASAAFAQPGLHPEEAIPDNLPRLASPGPHDDFIKQVQEKLNLHGFDAGPINGDFGEKTQAALAQFQLSQLLPASGMLDKDTLDALGLQRPEDMRASTSPDTANAAAGATSSEAD